MIHATDEIISDRTKLPALH